MASAACLALERIDIGTAIPRAPAPDPAPAQGIVALTGVSGARIETAMRLLASLRSDPGARIDVAASVPFGEGDTPITEVLHLLRDNQWPIMATIEFEYPVPEGSDRMTEIARSIKYCRDALT